MAQSCTENQSKHLFINLIVVIFAFFFKNMLFFHLCLSFPCFLLLSYSFALLIDVT